MVMNSCSLYSQYHERYKNVRMRSDQPPHIFWVADRAYQRMLQTHSNQTVLISGDSGAGKTESAKLLIQHIAFLCKSRVDNLHQKIIEVNHLVILWKCKYVTSTDMPSRFITLTCILRLIDIPVVLYLCEIIIIGQYD